MAQVSGGIERAYVLHPSLLTKEVKFVGWGAGSAFEEYSRFIPVKLSYTICPIEKNQGRNINGIEVFSPTKLLDEDTENTLVLVFSHHTPEVMTQIRKMGNYKVMRAYDVDDLPPKTENLFQLNSSLSSLGLNNSFANAADLGIFFQGPIFPYTPLILAFHRLRYPAAFILFVTPENQNRDLVRRCQKWVNKIIEYQQPSHLVPDYRNDIIRSCNIGAKYLQNIQVKCVVRLRSDAIITGSLGQVVSRYFSDSCKNGGKIGVYLGGSWRHIPFHYSDKFMIARANDMCRFWSVPEVNKSASAYMNPYTSDEHFLTLQTYTTESYIWMHYARMEKFETVTLKNSYDFGRERLLQLDEFVNMYSIKHMPMFTVKLDKNYSPSLDWWNRMCNDPDFSDQYAKNISALPFTVSDYWLGKIA